MEELVVLEVFRRYFPSVGSRAQLAKMAACFHAFGNVDDDKIEEYGQILERLQEAHRHGDANVTFLIRSGKIVDEEYGMRYHRQLDKSNKNR